MRLALVALVAAAALWQLGRRLRVEPRDTAPDFDIDWLMDWLVEPRAPYLTAAEWRN